MTFKILIIIIFFTSILRLIELFISKKNLIQRKSTESNLIQVKENYFFLFFILHISFLIVVPLEVYFLNSEFIFNLAILSGIIYIICLGLRLSVLKTLGKSWNTKIVLNQKESNGIITKGLYSYIRHPNYLIVILEIACISLFHSAYYSFLIYTICNFMILYFRIQTEERALFQNPTYHEFFKNKKRFIPYLF